MSASLKARLQKAEAELEVGVSHQRHLQVHLDSAATHNSALSQELEVELQNNAELASECKAHQSHCIQVINAFDSIVMTAHCNPSVNNDHRWVARCFACAKRCCLQLLAKGQPVG
jgi:glucose-6-phosphate-specific signal transduction histidine kinase